MVRHWPGVEGLRMPGISDWLGEPGTYCSIPCPSRQFVHSLPSLMVVAARGAVEPTREQRLSEDKAGRQCGLRAEFEPGGSSCVDDFVQDSLTVLRFEHRDRDEIDSHAEDSLEVLFDVHNLPTDRRGELDEYVNVARFRLLAAHVGAEEAQALNVEPRSQ
jgi:hypothetical protein